jgi:hypothetical protein
MIQDDVRTFSDHLFVFPDYASVNHGRCATHDLHEKAGHKPLNETAMGLVYFFREILQRKTDSSIHEYASEPFSGVGREHFPAAVASGSLSAKCCRPTANWDVNKA